LPSLLLFLSYFSPSLSSPTLSPYQISHPPSLGLRTGKVLQKFFQKFVKKKKYRQKWPRSFTCILHSLCKELLKLLALYLFFYTRNLNLQHQRDTNSEVAKLEANLGTTVSGTSSPSI
jgi:hypothetical protein